MARLRFDVLANLLGQGWAVLISLIFVPFFVRELGLERYAVIALLPVAVVLLQVLDLGLSTTANREMARAAATAPGSARTTLFTLLVVHLGLGAVVCAVAILAAATVGPAWLAQPRDMAPAELARGVLLLALIASLAWPMTLLQNALMGLGLQARVNALVAVHATVANVGAALVIGYIGALLPVFLGWFAVCAALQTAAAVLLLWRSLPHASEPVRFDRATLWRVWRFSGAAAGIGITGALLTYADRLVASRLLTLEQFGYYGLATTIGRSLYLLIAPVFSAVFPRLSGLAAARDTALIATLYSSSSQLMAFAIAAPAAVIFWMSFEAAFAWLGDAQAAAQIAPLAAMLVLGSALNGAMNLPYALQLANGLAYIGLRLNLLLVAVALPSAWVLGSAYGAVGVASTWLVINAVYFVVGVPVTHRVTRIGRPLRWAFGDMLPAFAAAGAGAGLCYLAFGPASTRAGAAALLAVALAVGYACALTVTPSVRIEMLSLARRGWRSLRPGQ